MSGVDENGNPRYHTERWIDYIFLQPDVYWGDVKKAEDKESLPIDLEFTVVLRITNPYKALFDINDWFTTTMNLLRPQIRGFVSTMRYEDIVAKKKAFSEAIKNQLSKADYVDDRLMQAGEKISST